MPENQTGETPDSALYARESTDQDEVSISGQLQATRDHAAENGLDPVKDYTDTGGSRDQFEQLIADATGANPPFQHILVYDLSRFSRSAQEFQEMQARLAANGVALRYVMEHD